MTPSAVVAVVAVAGLVAARPPAPPTVLPPRDFVEYWAAGRAHLAGRDPYDGPAVLPLQRAVDPGRDRPLMLWTPPWTLPLYWPFAALPPGPGHAAWVAAQVAAAAAAVRLTWAAYGGPGGPAGWAAQVGLAAGFAPVWAMVLFGQNTGLVALGAAGVVWGRAAGRPAAAGLFAALTAVKPHVLALFGLAFVLDGLFGRGRRPLAVGAAAVAALAGLAAVPSPRVYADYAAAVARPGSADHVPVSWWALPTAGYRLRAAAAGPALAADPAALFWVQFVPCAVGLAAAGAYWVRRRAGWDWRAEGPPLVLASALVPPYGGWVFDLTVLLVPVTAAAARLARGGRPVPAAAFAAVVLLASLAVYHPRVSSGALHELVWFTPAVTAAYLVARAGAAVDRAAPAAA